MSGTFNLPNEKAMALGGVATGNIYANEVEIVTGNIRYKGFFPIDSAYKNLNACTFNYGIK